MSIGPISDYDYWKLASPEEDEDEHEQPEKEDDDDDGPDITT